MLSVVQVMTMPEFSDTLLLLLGINSGTYLGFRLPEPVSVTGSWQRWCRQHDVLITLGSSRSIPWPYPGVYRRRPARLGCGRSRLGPGYQPMASQAWQLQHSTIGHRPAQTII